MWLLVRKATTRETSKKVRRGALSSPPPLPPPLLHSAEPNRLGTCLCEAGGMGARPFSSFTLNELEYAHTTPFPRFKAVAHRFSLVAVVYFPHIPRRSELYSHTSPLSAFLNFSSFFQNDECSDSGSGRGKTAVRQLLERKAVVNCNLHLGSSWDKAKSHTPSQMGSTVRPPRKAAKQRESRIYGTVMKIICTHDSGPHPCPSNPTLPSPCCQQINLQCLKHRT